MHEKKVADYQGSITMYRTGVAAGHNGPTVFLLKVRARWLDWRTKALRAMRTDLSTSLPAPPDDGRFKEFHCALGVASDKGCVVADSGGRPAREGDELGGPALRRLERRRRR